MVAVGETGLDFYRDRSPRDRQEAAFRGHIQLAKETGKPLIIHDRDAHDEVVRIMQEENAAAVGGVLHCFSGDLDMARKCVEMGFYISFAGPLTYPKNDELRTIAQALPIDVMLVETDCPYLAPQSWRGKRCEPALCQGDRRKARRGQGADPRGCGPHHQPQCLAAVRHRRRRPEHAYRLRDPQQPLSQHHQPLHQQLHLLRKVQGFHRQGASTLPGAGTVGRRGHGRHR